MSSVVRKAQEMPDEPPHFSANGANLLGHVLRAAEAALKAGDANEGKPQNLGLVARRGVHVLSDAIEREPLKAVLAALLLGSALPVLTRKHVARGFLFLLGRAVAGYSASR